jgi:hypothetical protein
MKKIMPVPILNLSHTAINAGNVFRVLTRGASRSATEINLTDTQLTNDLLKFILTHTPFDNLRCLDLRQNSGITSLDRDSFMRLNSRVYSAQRDVAPKVPCIVYVDLPQTAVDTLLESIRARTNQSDAPSCLRFVVSGAAVADT